MDYVLVDLEKSDFQDQHGNYWVTAAFEGVSEPVKWVVKDPTALKVGETYRGEIKIQTSKAGKEYNRFYREKPQDNSYSQGGNKSTYSRDDNAIRAQWAIGQSVAIAISQVDKQDPEKIVQQVEATAKVLYAMVDRVKVVTDTSLKADGVSGTTGIEQARAVADKLRPQPDEVHEVTEDPIDLSAIPF